MFNFLPIEYILKSFGFKFTLSSFITFIRLNFVKKRSLKIQRQGLFNVQEIKSPIHFAQHTALITNLLYLAEDEAESDLLFSQFLPKFRDEHKRSIKSVRCQTGKLIQPHERELLDTNEITIDRQVYYNQASAVIQAIDNLFEHQLIQIRKVLGVAKTQGI